MTSILMTVSNELIVGKTLVTQDEYPRWILINVFMFLIITKLFNCFTQWLNMILQGEGPVFNMDWELLLKHWVLHY